MKRDYNAVYAVVMDYDENIFCDYYEEVNCDMKPIHFKSSDGYEAWTEYDEYGNHIYYKNSYGDEIWSKYDEYGNCIYSKDHNGETWSEYDDMGNCTYYKSFSYEHMIPYESWTEYDEYNRITHFKNNKGVEYWPIYNEHGIEIDCRYNYDETTNYINTDIYNKTAIAVEENK